MWRFVSPVPHITWILNNLYSFQTLQIMPAAQFNLQLVTHKIAVKPAGPFVYIEFLFELINPFLLKHTKSKYY